jgi:hypothetical protein
MDCKVTVQTVNNQQATPNRVAFFMASGRDLGPVVPLSGTGAA